MLGGGGKCRKVKCPEGAREVVGISAERTNVREVCGRCVAGGEDKCRKVKCV